MGSSLDPETPTLISSSESVTMTGDILSLSLCSTVLFPSTSETDLICTSFLTYSALQSSPIHRLTA